MSTIGTAFTASILATGAMSLPVDTPDIEYSLSEEERDRIWNEIHFAVCRMYGCLDQADREASEITDVNIEAATKAAIAGAIGGMSTRNVYGVFVTSCLNTLGCIAGDAYWHFRESKRCVEEAEYYAYRADQLQERLWRDE